MMHDPAALLAENAALQARIADLEARLELAERTLEHLRDDVGSSSIDISEPREIEAALRRSEERYRILAHNLPNMAVILFDRDLRYTLAEGAALERHGYDQAAVVGKTIQEVIPTHNIKLLTASYQAALAGDAQTIEVEHKGRYYYSRILPARNVDGVIVGGLIVSEDVTERKQIESALREREAMLRAIGDNLPNSMIYQFVYNADRTWYYTYVSAGIERVSGITADQLFQNPMLLRDMIVPEDMARVLAAEAVSFEHLVTFDIEVRKQLPSGEIRWSRLCSQPRRLDDERVVWDGIETDITEQKYVEAALLRLTTELEARVANRTARLTETIQRLEHEVAEHAHTEAALRESQRFVERIAAVSPVSLCVYDLQIHQVVYANPQFKATLTRWMAAHSELTLTDMIAAFRPDEQMAAAMRSGFATLDDDAVFEFEYCVRLDDSLRWFTVYCVVFVRSPEGRVVQVLMSALDITARRQSEEELHAYSRRLIDVQEAERAHIARELHDEIGQMLTGLNLRLEVAVQADPATIQRHIRAAQSLVNDATSRVRELSLDLRPAILDDLGLLAALVWMVNHYAEQTGVQVTVQHTGLDVSFAPEIALTAYRVVQEALTNVARHAAVEAAALQLWTTSETLYVQVTDHGRGFDMLAVLNAHESSGLTGMHERVRLLGGTLSIDASPGIGTCVIAELPLQ